MDGFVRRKKRKKHSILEAALNLFIEYGIKKVPIAEIAKHAHVSQVTIYNYFGSKDELVHAVIEYFVEKEWSVYEEILKSKLPFPEKIEKIIFSKKESADHISGSFFTDFMQIYADGESYIEELYNKDALPAMMNLFDEGKKEGHINPQLSNEAIMVFIQMFTDYMKRKDVYPHLLDLTEDLTAMFFYGICGKKMVK